MPDDVLSCLADGVLICLDVRRGRYFRPLPSAKSDKRPDDALTGLEAGAVPAIDRATDDIMAELPDRRSLLRWLAPAFLAIIVARIAVRTCPFRTLVWLAAGRRSERDIDRQRLVDRIAAWRSVRRWLPLAKKCLPDSFALLVFLRWTGIAGHLVVGVTGRPFSAHCWTRVGSIVVTEPVEAVSRFTPILTTAWPAAS
jgi:hypothetical protein